MERFGRGPSLAALLAALAVTCAVAHADSDDPPPRGADLGLAIARLDEAWRDLHAYRSSGVMVVGVDPKARAAKSGIVRGDVLVSVAGRTMREPSDLGYAERSLSPDRAVSVVLARDGGRTIKIFQIAPEEAAPAVAVEPAAEPGPPASNPTADPAVLPTVSGMATTSDATSPPVVVTPTADTSESSLPAATASGAADTATSATASSTSALESGTEAGAAGSAAGAGAAASVPLALSVPAAIIAVPEASAVVEPGASRASASATVDSGGMPPESVEPAPGVLGVVGKSLTRDLADALGASVVEGIFVIEVAAASPADRSGVRAGDIILKVGAQPVSDMGELQRAITASPTPIQITTFRLGKSQVASVSLDGPPLVPIPPPSQEQLMMELRDEVRSLRREVQGLRKKLGK